MMLLMFLFTSVADGQKLGQGRSGVHVKVHINEYNDIFQLLRDTWWQRWQCQTHSEIGHPVALASPAMGHWGTCPLDFQLFIFFWSLLSRTNSDIRLHVVAHPEKNILAYNFLSLFIAW